MERDLRAPVAERVAARLEAMGALTPRAPPRPDDPVGYPPTM
jgi:hypothetical protein